MSSNQTALIFFTFISLILLTVAYSLYHYSIKNNHWLLVMGKLEEGTAVLQRCSENYLKGRTRAQQAPTYHIVLKGKNGTPSINIKSQLQPKEYPYYDLYKLYYSLKDYPKNKPIPILWKKNAAYKGHDIIASIDGKTGFGKSNLLAFVLFLVFSGIFLLFSWLLITSLKN